MAKQFFSFYGDNWLHEVNAFLNKGEWEIDTWEFIDKPNSWQLFICLCTPVVAPATKAGFVVGATVPRQEWEVTMWQGLMTDNLPEGKKTLRKDKVLEIIEREYEVDSKGARVVFDRLRAEKFLYEMYGNVGLHKDIAHQ